MNIENMFDKPDVKQLVHAFSLLDDENDIQAFLTDICTPREICDLSQRLQVRASPMLRFRPAPALRPPR